MTVTTAVKASARAATRQDVFPNLPTDVKKFPVRHGEEPWTVDEVMVQATGLLDDQVRLSEELVAAERSLDDLLRNSGDGAGDDQADYGSSALEREHELTMVNNLRSLLSQTEHALGRLQDGSYATCEVTGNAIGKARLQAFPRATLSVEAKAREERR
ncbi:MAG: TraR/DksA C4-type zinc finger protein [Cellulomonadaceae bacterium]|jgi:DnaK suppressor protein|nr:TraR/DksA C4-type zinc finger protein [Cellulomonadaceae bacterium]